VTRRTLVILSLAFALVMAFAAGVKAASSINLVINGTRHTVSGFIVDGQGMVPLEEITRLLGGTFAWKPEEETAVVNLPVADGPQGDDLQDSCIINVTRITEGLSILTVAGEVTNISNSTLHSLTVHGRLFDAGGAELARTYTYRLNPPELYPGETGTFEIIFLEYDKFRDKNTRYAIYVQGFSL